MAEKIQTLSTGGFSDYPSQATTRYTSINSPVGRLTLIGDGEVLTHLTMEGHEDPKPTFGDDWIDDNTAFAQARAELDEYFAGQRQSFDTPIAPRGTEFRMRVWRELTAIPYGRSASYAEIAAGIGQPRATRAVGGANHHNPIAIIVPCHRVVGKDGSLTGYGGGLERKTLLLELEAAHR